MRGIVGRANGKARKPDVRLKGANLPLWVFETEASLMLQACIE
jgi:hypothetical protein